MEAMETYEQAMAVRQRESASSGLSWGAIIGGAFVAAGLSLIMLALGAGFGLSAVSPWSNIGASAATAGTVAIVWLVFTQLVSLSMGGYLAGRLRTRWHTIHNDEVHFRDTANGFLVWAVTLVVTVSLLGAAAASMAGHAASSTKNMEDTEIDAYYVDSLFRSPAAKSVDPSVRQEASRILTKSMLISASSAPDKAYLAQLVAAQTGIELDSATKRVSDTLDAAREAADQARKATAHLLLWIFLSLLIGAFCASFAATVGGRQRDRVQHI